MKKILKNEQEELPGTILEGCAWKTLTFKAEGAKTVNQFGMTSLKKEQLKENSDLANFSIHH